MFLLILFTKYVNRGRISPKMNLYIYLFNKEGGKSMYCHDVSIQEFIHNKAFGVILEKVLTIRGISKSELANSTSLNIAKIIKGNRNLDKD